MSNWLTRLFRRERKSIPLHVDNLTVPLSDEQLQSVDQINLTTTPGQFVVGVGQSIGLQREHNEDSLFALSTILADGVNDLPYGIFIIADGMGGHQHGELASSIATRVVASALVTSLDRLFRGVEFEDQFLSLQEMLEQAVAEAQLAVQKKVPGGGTTLTAALAVGDQVMLAHVGDSRAYFLYLDGRIQSITQDHTLVQRLIDLGEITPAEARTHPQRNVLYRAVGQSEPLQADIQVQPLPRPGYLLLCSDGLWGVLSEADIYHIVRSNENPSEACRRLVEAANEQGGPDNISAVLVYIPA